MLVLDVIAVVFWGCDSWDNWRYHAQARRYYWSLS